MWLRFVYFDYYCYYNLRFFYYCCVSFDVLNVFGLFALNVYFACLLFKKTKIFLKRSVYSNKTKVNENVKKKCFINKHAFKNQFKFGYRMKMKRIFSSKHLECDVTFGYVHWRKINSIKKNSPLFTATAKCRHSSL